MMLRIALAVGLLASTEASAHCYSRWYYPQPQRCGVARQMVRRPVLHSVAASSIPNQEHLGNEARLVRGPSGPAVEIALPGLAQADFDGGGADEPTRARLLLRAALEAYNAH
jgi:hypothetical protein